MIVNDVHSRLNPTCVARVVTVRSVADIQKAVRNARSEGRSICVAGGRHAMGGQQFADGAVLLDMRRFNRMLAFDPERGHVEVESGIQWPELMDGLHERQPDSVDAWGIAQKQSGADRLSIGGALAANIHGRGLTMRPIVSDVESFTIIDALGRLRACDRGRNPELFATVVGGYGLFGVVASVTLRLVRRRKLRRRVEIVDVADLPDLFERRIESGDLYGDFQYATDERSADFMRRGVISTYAPVPDETPMPERHRVLTEDDWRRLVHLAHVDKRRAFDTYTSHYLATAGQVYWSDEHQRSVYLDDYHAAIDRGLGNGRGGSELIGEICVRRHDLVAFMEDARRDLIRNGVNIIYGTVRLIERDDESFLAWAREPWACVIFNLHTEHTSAGIAHTKRAFRRLIALAMDRGGSYYLTYGRNATRRQVDACHPRFRDFLRLKRAYDRGEIFQSDWYRHYRAMFAERKSARRRSIDTARLTGT